MTDEFERARAIIKFKDSPWIPKLRELYDYLESIEDQTDLLRKIDQEMTTGTGIVDFLKEHLLDLAALTVANSDAHFYIDDEEVSYLIASSQDVSMPQKIDRSAFAKVLDSESKDPVFVRTSELQELGLDQFPDQSGFLFLPFWLQKLQNTNGNRPEWPPHDRRFGWFVLRDPKGFIRLSKLNDLEVKKYAQSVLTQLAIGIRVRFEREQSEWFEQLTNYFFESQLDPDACFEKLVQHIPQYLPDFGMYQMTATPEVSILIEVREPEKEPYLLMVANTTEKKNIGIKLQLRESVVGLVFEQPDRPYIMGNPQLDPELKTRYKAYSGKNKPTHSELVMPIQSSQGKRIAAINLETHVPYAYKGLHVAALRHLCLVVAQMVTALFDRIVERQQQQQALMEAQQSYWSSIGALLLHDTNGPMAAIRAGVDNARKAEKKKMYDLIEPSLEPVIASLEVLSERIDKFSQEIYRSNIFGEYSVREIISKADKTIKEKARQANVVVDFIPGEDFAVFCSPALEIHIFNIIDNSISWIQDRVKTESGVRGRISIKTEDGPEPADNEEKDLNRTCLVILEDNGNGAPPDVVDKLFNMGVESRRQGGMGRALYAVGQYVRLLGGSVKAESEVGKYFRVIMTLPIFNPRIHRVENKV